jgi:hypothetical protein
MTGLPFTLAPALSVQMLGSGSGTVTSVPAGTGGISCLSGPDTTGCSATFAGGVSVELHASASAGSDFLGWGGDCTGYGTCVVDMTATHSVTATFTGSQIVRIGSVSYPSLQSAYDVAGKDDVIMLLEGVFSGSMSNLIANRKNDVTIRGGYAGSYALPVVSETILQGVVQLRDGTVRFESVKIRPAP